MIIITKLRKVGVVAVSSFIVIMAYLLPKDVTATDITTGKRTAKAILIGDSSLQSL